MALYTELPVYRDTYQLVLKVFELTKDFSREFKYTLGQEMRYNYCAVFFAPTKQ